MAQRCPLAVRDIDSELSTVGLKDRGFHFLLAFLLCQTWQQSPTEKDEASVIVTTLNNPEPRAVTLCHTTMSMLKQMVIITSRLTQNDGGDQ